jgi:flavorubredoxin
MFGNTEKIARALARGLIENGVETECLNLNAVDPEKLWDYRLVAIGAPTMMFTASNPSKEFLARLEGKSFKGRYGFAFDTRLDSRLSGSAAKYIENKLREVDFEILEGRASAIVNRTKDTKNPGGVELSAEEETHFERLGASIAEELISKLMLQQTV